MSRKAIIIILLAIAVLVLSRVNTGSSFTWDPSYERGSTDPLGSKVFYEYLERTGQLSGRSIDGPLSTSLDDVPQREVVMIITEAFVPDEGSLDSLLAFIRRGGSVMISATEFDEDVEDALELVTYSSWSSDDFYVPDSARAITGDADLPDLYTQMRWVADTLDEDSEVEASESLSENPWSPILQVGSELETRDMVIGERRLGKGRVIISTVSPLFTNHAMLYDRLYPAVEHVCAVLPRGTITWDQHYKPFTKGEGGMAIALKEYPGLKFGYYAIAITAIIFLVVDGRRRQRAIPVRTPPRNTSMDYVKTIADLYHVRVATRHAAERLAAQFTTYVRHRTGLRLQSDEHITAEHLSVSLGIPIDVIERLLACCDRVEQGWEPTYDEIRQFNNDIQQTLSQGAS